jgi:hypothetical protein
VLGELVNRAEPISARAYLVDPLAMPVRDERKSSANGSVTVRLVWSQPILVS